MPIWKKEKKPQNPSIERGVGERERGERWREREREGERERGERRREREREGGRGREGEIWHLPPRMPGRAC